MEGQTILPEICKNDLDHEGFWEPTRRRLSCCTERETEAILRHLSEDSRWKSELDELCRAVVKTSNCRYAQALLFACLLEGRVISLARRLFALEFEDSDAHLVGNMLGEIGSLSRVDWLFVAEALVKRGPVEKL